MNGGTGDRHWGLEVDNLQRTAPPEGGRQRVESFLYSWNDWNSVGGPQARTGQTGAREKGMQNVGGERDNWRGETNKGLCNLANLQEIKS
ncbi:hypothetical protein ElyMa_006770900 [Elysia marginata]|uniref:Uncharacterized protein n=1 Tax=Elysia marginata TaxID=1093978 RepID=A0AAV4IZ76_9GAST|nr:hypothetical protein ElyMa_006770900 [Elysia marginata]